MTTQLFTRRLQEVENAIYVCEMALAAVSLVILVASLSAIIVARYSPGWAVDWAPAIANIFIIWLAWFGTGIATRARTHLIIDVLTHGLKTAKARRMNANVVGAIMIVYGICIIYFGIPYAMGGLSRHFDMLPMLPKFWVFIALPAGCTLMIFHTLINMYLDRGN